MSDQPTLLSGDDRIEEVDIAERMEQSFLDYSMSVIIGRALPDVRDGLKPVQRRILYGMWEAGMRPDRPYRKCAAAVGDVMRKYHPHGDVSIYDALVRMAQDFSTREPLVDGQGNFGSVDGDGAAAMRYTEARLSAVAMELLAGIDEDTVDLIANYDGEWREPVVLPARFPNVLVNGASGIAVGMATSIPPHNLAETVAACQLLIDNPDATVDELMGVLPAPDFPTGGRILNTSGIRDAYLTGRGAITTEAVATTETRSGGLPRIVVTEIPYQVNKATLLEKIADHVKNKKIDEIRDLRDESSRDGMRVVIELKRGEDPGQVLAKLYHLTDLRLNFHANLVALVGGQPRTVGLREILVAYLDHQREVLVRRTTHRRDKAAARVHVLEGLLTALDHLDDVIALIRAADTVDDARAELMARYDLSETQATAILDMQLRRLAALERQKLVDEHAQLVAYIEELEAILADPGRLDELLSTELAELTERHPSPRRSQLADPEEEGGGSETTGAAPSARLAAQETTVYVTAGGYVKPVERRRTAKPHSHPKDPVVAVLRATTEDSLLAVDTAGTGYRIPLADVPVVTMRQRGTTIAQLLGEAPGSPLAGAVVLDGSADTVVTVSAGGQVKRTDAAEYDTRGRTIGVAGIRDGDRLARVATCGADDEVLLAHDRGLAIRFAANEARAMGRTATGVAGMKIPDGAAVVSLSVVPAGAADDVEVITVAADGGAKRVPLAEYPAQSRGGKGVQTGVSALAWCGVATDLHVPTDDGPAVLRRDDVAAGRRSGSAKPATAAVAGPVVGEQGA